MNSLSRAAGCALVLTLFVPGLGATTYLVPFDRQLIAKSDAIVIGIAEHSETIEGDGGLETITRFLVLEGVKAIDSGNVIVITEPGGMKGRKTTLVEGAPRFDPGERAMLFLSAQRDRWTVTDFRSGSLPVSFHKSWKRCAGAIRARDRRLGSGRRGACGESP